MDLNLKEIDKKLKRLIKLEQQNNLVNQKLHRVEEQVYQGKLLNSMIAIIESIAKTSYSDIPTEDLEEIQTRLMSANRSLISANEIIKGD